MPDCGQGSGETVHFVVNDLLLGGSIISPSVYFPLYILKLAVGPDDAFFFFFQMCLFICD